MQTDFPELTTIGTLFVFARRLEEAGAELFSRLADAETGERAEAVRRVAKKHGQRAAEIEQARKEKMNETVLEPLTGLDHSSYVPPLDGLGADAGTAALRKAALALEERSVRFYTDAADKAGPVIGEVRRIFLRLAKDNERHASMLR
jgi:hypothetical protein